MTVLVDPRKKDALLLQTWQRMKLKAEQAKPPDPRLAEWQKRPDLWINDRLSEHTWSKQREIVRSVVEHRRTAVPSAHETGKSFIAARLVCWWLSVWPIGDAFAVTTATTGAQVKAILWREINRAHAKAGLVGRTTQTEWWIGPEQVAMGRKPSDYNQAAFQGIHARRVLVVIDEAAGVSENLFRAAASLTANDLSRMLAIGNPDDPASHFANICKPDSGWNVIEVDGLTSPNFTEEEIPEELRDLLLGKTYEREIRTDEGCRCDSFMEHLPDCPIPRSGLYQAKIRGKFVTDTDNGVVPLSWVRRCQRLELDPPGADAPNELGVDVGAGGDATTIRHRHGAFVGRSWTAKTPDPEVACRLVCEAIDETGANCVKVDSNGIGWALISMIRRDRPEVEVVGVNVGEGSTDRTQFPKLRDQLWWEVGRELSRNQAWDLSALDERTVAQLIAPKFIRTAGGQVKVESKDDLRRSDRLGRSPDDADALLLAFYETPSINVWSL